MERRLGRGLSSLLGATRGQQDQEKAAPTDQPRDGEVSEQTPAQDGESTIAAPAEDLRSSTQPGPDGVQALESSPRSLPIDRLQANAWQPRKVFEQEHLEELTSSIRQHGILQPITVRPREDHYEIISGERRWRAARAAGLAEVPVTVREATDREMLELALVENVQRQDLDAMEKARGFQEMMKRLQLTQEEVSAKVGLKRSTVANHLRLLDLPEPVQQGVARGLLTMGHARALLGLPSKGEILNAFQKVVREELSVRATEALVRGPGAAPAASAGSQANEEKGAARAPSGGPDQAPWARDLERRLQESLGIRAQVQDSGNGKYRGRLVLHYHDRAELERLMERLAPRDVLS